MKEGQEPKKGKAAYGGTFPTKTSERADTEEVLGEKKVVDSGGKVVIITTDHSSGTYPKNDITSNMEELMGGGTCCIAP